MRENLIELLQGSLTDIIGNHGVGALADHLIANGVTIQRWIPVSERLPKDNERVLVYHDDGVMRFGINKDGFADVVSSLYLRNNHRTCFSKVTHWMPLPLPPKEGE